MNHLYIWIVFIVGFSLISLLEPFPTSNAQESNGNSLGLNEQEYLTSPKNQMLEVISKENVDCRAGLELVFRIPDSTPSCVKSTTIQPLVLRNWIMDQEDIEKYENFLKGKELVEQDEKKTSKFNEINDEHLIKQIPNKKIKDFNLIQHDQPIISVSKIESHANEKNNILVIDKIANKNSLEIDKITVKINSQSKKQHDNSILLQESDVDTGLFIGDFLISDYTDIEDGEIIVTYLFDSNRLDEVAVGINVIGLAPEDPPDPPDPPEPVFDPHAEESIWRAQIELTTADVGHANTDDWINLTLDVYRTDATWLDYGRDDFEKGDTFTYDLDIRQINSFDDIRSIFISKEGDNGWCVQKASLILNNVKVFEKSYEHYTDGCQWLDTERGRSPHVWIATHDELRSHQNWIDYRKPLVLSIPGQEIEQRIEGLTGSMNKENSAYWGGIHNGRAVEAWKSDVEGAVHVDLDLKGDVPFFPDPEIDIDFDLIFSCDDSTHTINIVAENVVGDADSSIFWEIVTLSLQDTIDWIVGAATPETFPVNLSLDSGLNFCPTIEILDDGTVAFGLP